MNFADTIFHEPNTLDILDRVDATTKSACPTKLKLSINPRIIDKNIYKDTNAYSQGWVAHELTLEELADQINRGCAFSAQYEEDIRKGAYFDCADFIAADFDGTMSLEQAYQNEFINSYGSILYTTPSHQKDGKDRFRVVFHTPITITSAKTWSYAQLGLASKLAADTSATDSARLFYGSRNSNPVVLRRCLSQEALDELIVSGRKLARKTKVPLLSSDTIYIDTSERAPNRITRTQLIRCANGDTACLPDIAPRTPVHCPVHNDQHPSAFTLRSQRGSPGIHCSTCKKTYWLENDEPHLYDFYRFERYAEGMAATLPKIPSNDNGTVQEVHIINKRYLPALPLVNGIVYVKSPKGTGKTERIRDIVQNAKAQGWSVLLIGHRRTLIRELSSRVKLHCYLDDTDGRCFDKKKQQLPDYYAVSIDSLFNRLQNKSRQFDIVIIDECEQVLSHITAETVRNRAAVCSALQKVISTSPSVYLLDADLNDITHNFVERCRRTVAQDDIRIYVNKYVDNNRTYKLFQSDKHLTSDMLAAVKSGKRIFAACNSKKRAKILSKLLELEAPSARTLLITSDSKMASEVIDFLADVRNKFLCYDAVIASPAIGTGIDITFGENAEQVDVVYGFFNARINSHYDCDQQIGRVRHPKEVKVWLSHERFFFETDPNAIKLHLIRVKEGQEAVVGYDSAGRPMFNPNHPLLVLQADVYCAQRASQNRLKDLFIAHKLRNGWRAEYVGKDGDAEQSIDPTLVRTKKLAEQERVNRLLSANKIDENGYIQLMVQRESGTPLTAEETSQIERFEIEQFYCEPISRELICCDNEGATRKEILLLEEMRFTDPTEYQTLCTEWQETKSIKHIAPALGIGKQRSIRMALFASGLLTDKGLDAKKIFRKDDLQDFTRFCDEWDLIIQKDLALVLRRDKERDPVRTLNTFLSHIGQKAVLAGSTNFSGKKVYKYKLDSFHYEFTSAACERRKKNNANWMLAEIRMIISSRARPPISGNDNSTDSIYEICEAA